MAGPQQPQEPRERRGPAPIPTAHHEFDLGRQRRARAFRRVLLGLLVLFIGLGLGGVFGVRSAEVSAARQGYTLVVTYAAMSRPGLATPWSVRVRREGGFDGPVVIATTGTYFDLFDENGLDPDPASAWTAGDLLVWEFDPPDGETLTVTFDARLEPARQSGASATTSVLVDGRAVVSASYTTRVMP